MPLVPSLTLSRFYFFVHPPMFPHAQQVYVYAVPRHICLPFDLEYLTSVQHLCRGVVQRAPRAHNRPRRRSKMFGQQTRSTCLTYLSMFVINPILKRSTLFASLGALAGYRTRYGTVLGFESAVPPSILTEVKVLHVPMVSYLCEL